LYTSLIREFKLWEILHYGHKCKLEAWDITQYRLKNLEKLFYWNSKAQSAIIKEIRSQLRKKITKEAVSYNTSAYSKSTERFRT